MKWKLYLGTLVLAMGLSTQSFGFEVLNRMLGASGHHSGGCCDAGCCEPACGAADACCEPACGAADACCDTGCDSAGCFGKKHCGGLLSGLFKRHSCTMGCDAGCCEPACGAANACCEPACGAANACEPTCGAMDACCNSGCDSAGCLGKKHCGGLLSGLLKRHSCKMGCDAGCCEPACGAANACEPTCGAMDACCDSGCDSAGCCGGHKLFKGGLLGRLMKKHKHGLCCDSGCDAGCCEPACGAPMVCDPSCGAADCCTGTVVAPQAPAVMQPTPATEEAAPEVPVDPSAKNAKKLRVRNASHVIRYGR